MDTTKELRQLAVSTAGTAHYATKQNGRWVQLCGIGSRQRYTLEPIASEFLPYYKPCKRCGVIGMS